MKKLFLPVFLFVITQHLFSQKGRKDYQYEFRATSENDNYALTFVDGYYTNGLYVQFSKPARWKTNQNLEKITTTFKLGQMIFNSENYDDETPQTIDRPLSGYLFLQKNLNFFYKNGHVLQTSLAIGGTGKASLAKQIQSWFHNLAGLSAVTGWPYQLNGEASLNLSAQYNYNLTGIKNQHTNFELTGIAVANFGNAFSNTTAGLLMRIGNFEDPENSSFYNARIGKGTGEKLKRNAELFFYFNPQVVQQFYNATVQGPLFREDKGPLTAGLVRQLYMHRIGFIYSERNWLLDLHYVMKNREAKSMRKKEKYASITLGYRIGDKK